MKQIKFVHFADLHLDMAFSSLNSVEGLPELRREQLKMAFNRIIEVVIEQDADVLFITGDLYEHDYVRKSTISFINEGFKKIFATQVYIVPGNHDPFLKGSYYKDFMWNKNVHILAGDAAFHENDQLGLRVFGLGFSTFSQPDLSAMSYISSSHTRWEEEQYINVLLIHGAPGIDFGNDSYNPIKLEWVDKFKFNYVGFGHFHNTIMGIGKHKNIYNPGSSEALGFDEPGEHGIITGILDKAHSNSLREVQYIPISRVRYETFEVNLEGCMDDEDFIKKVYENIASTGSNKTRLISVSLKGTILNNYSPDITYIQKRLNKEFLFVKIKDETQNEINYKEIAAQPGLKGLFVKKMLDRLEATTEETTTSMLYDALKYGLQALEQGRLEVEQ